MNEERLLKPALIGGVLLGILSSLPLFNCLCCVWMIGGGVLAAYLFVKDSPAPVTLGRGVTLGLLTGCLGTIVMALFFVPLHMLLNPGVTIMEQMRQSMNQLPNVPPETRQLLATLEERSGIIYAIGFIFMLIVSCLFSMAGGAIGVAIFEKRNSRNVPPSYQPPINIPPPPPPPDAG